VRLLVITDLYPPIALGGYERTCADLVEGLRERHDVTVLTSTLRRRGAPPTPWIRRELRYLGPERRELARVPAAAAHAARVTRRILGEVRPDLVYVSNCLGVSQAAPLVAADAGLPVVYRLSELWFASNLYRGDRFVGHLFPGHRGLHRPWASVVRAANRHPALRLEPTRAARAAISWCSDDLRSRVDLLPTLKPVLERTIHCGSASPFEELERCPAARPTVAYAGRLTTAKGAEVAVHALAALRDGHAIDARLVLAGPCRPAMARRLRRLAADLDVSDSVELAGQLETDALGRLLQTAHVVVVPTVEYEGFGRICVEAARARVPVVASRLGGIPEALHDREHALLFPPGDAEACAAAVAATLRDPAAAELRVWRAFEHVRRFSLESFVTATEALFDETAGRW
jgi:glycosyltransferase involved in cell wall biosynthesis